MYVALELGISAGEFWTEFTPRGILLIARQRTRGAGKGKGGAGGAPVRIGRIPR